MFLYKGVINPKIKFQIKIFQIILVTFQETYFFFIVY